MEFLKSNEVGLNPANYLVSTITNKPVTHVEFVAQQRAAEYIVKLAAAIKGKNFTAGTVDNLDAIKRNVLSEINQTNKTTYVDAPEAPVSKINNELVQYALDFVKFQEKKDKTNIINEMMNTYNKINDVEKVGEYFSEGLVKLNKIYSIKEILKAVKEVSEKLD